MHSRGEFVTSLQETQRKKHAAQYGEEQKVAHMCGLAVCFFVIWLLLTLKEKAQEPSVVVLPHTPSDAIDESVYLTETLKHEPAHPSLLRTVCGWTCLAVATGALVLQVTVGSAPTSSGTLKDKPQQVQSASQSTDVKESSPHNLRTASPFRSSAAVRSSALSSGKGLSSTQPPPSVVATSGRPRVSRGQLRSAKDLERLLLDDARRSAARTVEPTAAAYAGTQGFPMKGLYQQAQERAMHVKFSAVQREVETTAAADTEWSALGVRDVELSTLRVQEWISKTLQAVVQDINQCNRWFAEKQLSAFDCNNSLKDTFTVNAPQSTTATWGAQPTQSNQKVRKLECLQNEKGKLLTQPHTTETYQDIVMLENRVKLEALLDLSETFPPSAYRGQTTGSAYESEATRSQTYIIRRLKTLAAQPNLSGYRANGGEDVWTEEYPMDAHLVVHVLLQHHPAFARHVRLPHQPLSERRDLSIYVGNTGEPYFYVKYRNPPAVPEKLFHTKSGNESLFQAIVICVALIAKHHDGAYGGVFGVLDLEQLGLSEVLRR